MQGYNCIIVYNNDRTKLLFCKRTKDPYKGLYNLVGGKIEHGENGFISANRELEEETGIGRQDIEINHMMDFTYYNQNCYVEVYVGFLKHEVVLQEEKHPLVWLDPDENYFDLDRFAGEGNIGHMIEQVKQYGTGKSEISNSRAKKATINKATVCIGIDGCKGGWIGAIINQGELIIQKFDSLTSIVEEYPNFNEVLIDMVIGIPSNKDHMRPDRATRKLVKGRASTIFPAPCRQAVYAETVALAYEENERVLGKKFTPLTVGIIPKIREVDSFFQDNPEYKNLVKESHPEVCFAMLQGKTLMSKKNEINGMEERISILRPYLPEISLNMISNDARKYRCNVDDIIDAICLAVTANMITQNKYQVIPENPDEDVTGLKMQMIIPKI